MEICSDVVDGRGGEGGGGGNGGFKIHRLITFKSSHARPHQIPEMSPPLEIEALDRYEDCHERGGGGGDNTVDEDGCGGSIN